MQDVSALMRMGVCVHVCMVPLLQVSIFCVLNISLQCRYLSAFAITPGCARIRIRGGVLICCFVFQAQSFCGVFFLLTKNIQGIGKESKQKKFETTYSSRVIFTCCSLQFFFSTCSQKPPKISRNFCFCFLHVVYPHMICILDMTNIF